MDIRKDIERRFRYHKPDARRLEMHEAINKVMIHTALVVTANTPGSREQSLAITKLEEARMWANAAIACNVEDEDGGALIKLDGRPGVTTTDGEESDGVTAGAPKPVNPKTGQHGAYYVLSEEERAKGFVRPVRRTYKHRSCGITTTMAVALAETYARDPSFYGSTFCSCCKAHKPVAEFIWDGTDEQVGS